MRGQKHRVILTPEALANLAGIAAFIRRDAPQQAKREGERILGAIDALAVMPARFKRVGQSRSSGAAVHARVIRPYVVYYRIDEQQELVYVLQVTHGRMRQPRRFP